MSMSLTLSIDTRGCTVRRNRVKQNNCIRRRCTWLHGAKGVCNGLRVIWRGDYQINGVAQLPVRAVSRRIVMQVAARCKVAASLAVQQLECQNDAVTKYTPIGERFCM